MIELPVLPMRDGPVFPGEATVLDLGRPASVVAARAALTADGRAFVLCQRDPHHDEPVVGGFFDVGCIAALVLLDETPHAMRVEARPLGRARVHELRAGEGHATAVVASLDSAAAAEPPLGDAQLAVLRALAAQVTGRPADDDLPPGVLVARIVARLALAPAEVQWFLENDGVHARVARLLDRGQLAFEDARAQEARGARQSVVRWLFGRSKRR